MSATDATPQTTAETAPTDYPQSSINHQSYQPTADQSQQTSQPSTGGQKQKGNSGGKKKGRSFDPLLDAWYFNEINKRDGQDAQLFKNYQINPYTKKTLDYVTPKITERRKVLPKQPPPLEPWELPPCDEDCANQMSEMDRKVLESYKIVKNAMDRSVNPPQKKFCEPQTELMRLGWFPKLAPPPPPKTCLYMCMKNSPSPCCYFYPTPPEDLFDETYDERFRAVHQTQEFIKTTAELRRFDAIMNPNGYRGQIITPKKRPSGTPSPGKK